MFLAEDYAVFFVSAYALAFAVDDWVARIATTELGVP